jgi:transposase-like protein
VAGCYQKQYQQILGRLVRGNLIHVDETKIRLQGRDAFVWVFTSIEDVAYVYAVKAKKTAKKTVA